MTSCNCCRRLFATMQASLEMRVLDWLLGREQPLPGDLAIALHQIRAVLLEQALAMALVVSRNLVPWQSRLLMMRHMEIVIEEQQGNDRVGLDEDLPAAHLLMGTMLGIGPHH